MGHGLPDFGATSAPVTTYGLDDLGELAARLGSIVTYDRRGDVVFLEDFESGLAKWEASLGGVDGDVYLSMEDARSGLLSVCLLTPSADELNAMILRAAALPSLTATGLEVSFLLASDIGTVDLVISLYDGVYYNYWGGRYDASGERVQYRDSAGDYQDVESPYSLSLAYSMFHTFKLVCDPVTHCYRRVLLDGKQWNLPGVEGAWGEDDRAPYVWVAVIYTGSEGANWGLWVDDVILTHNEP